ncbi:MAG: anhydro-N-acetylmuramic acid kinase [Schleiferiaceae bacterium]|nr:anhydro-N-acetylmuramic acid kinase [Schleiferiaceae bacterium]
MKQNFGKSARCRVLGLMSGTSLDGLDLALVEWQRAAGKWQYQIKAVDTLPYTPAWQQRLQFNPQLSAPDLLALNNAYGRLLAQQVQLFCEEQNFPLQELDLIASHGHTYWHQPQRGFTYQLGSGPELAIGTGRPAVVDFRQADVARGGQGAPLAPLGDRDLFPQYEAWLNLGGIANLTRRGSERWQAFDIAAANQVLDHLARRAGQDYDDGGQIARSGRVLTSLLERLEALPYYQQAPPKSLGIEWTRTHIFPLLNAVTAPLADLMRTYVEHLARQMARELPPTGSVLITGGGAYHHFLIERLEALSKATLYRPEPALINYKEALIFSYLGLLRFHQENNVIGALTGAPRPHSSGTLHLP